MVTNHASDTNRRLMIFIIPLEYFLTINQHSNFFFFLKLITRILLLILFPLLELCLCGGECLPVDCYYPYSGPDCNTPEEKFFEKS